MSHELNIPFQNAIAKFLEVNPFNSVNVQIPGEEGVIVLYNGPDEASRRVVATVDLKRKYLRFEGEYTQTAIQLEDVAGFKMSLESLGYETNHT